MYNSYQTCISNVLNNNMFHLFKSFPDYKEILEHVSEDLGKKYLETIDDKIDIDIIQKLCNINDSVGSPTIIDFGKVRSSPSSLRYINHAFKILTYLKSLNLSSVKIVEVGGGYGGLCLIIYHLNKLMFNLSIEEYIIIDLAEPLLLQQKYLETNNVDIPLHYYNASTFGSTLPSTDYFLISNYCISEIDPQFRQTYYKFLFPKVKHGFIIWNHQAIDLIVPHEIFPEDPQTDLNNFANKEVHF